MNPCRLYKIDILMRSISLPCGICELIYSRYVVLYSIRFLTVSVLLIVHDDSMVIPKLNVFESVQGLFSCVKNYQRKIISLFGREDPLINCSRPTLYYSGGLIIS